MVLLTNDKFLTELTLFYQTARQRKPSLPVTLTMKRYDGIDRPRPKDPERQAVVEEYKCLFRAQLKNKKISTVVEAKDTEKFLPSFNAVMRGNLDNLKKVKKVKAKTKTVAS